jgi:hypothetical protein
VTRRLALLAMLLPLGCGGGSPSTAPVPQTLSAALDEFLVAVKANNLSRMGQLWGTDRGPAAEWMQPELLRQRVTVIQKYLAHTGYRVVEGPSPVPGKDNVRAFRVELQQNGCNHVQPIDVTKTRSGGWIVVDVHLEAAGSPGSTCGNRP